MVSRLVISSVGTPRAVKVACVVWVGGKAGDRLKGLPINIINFANPPATQRRVWSNCLRVSVMGACRVLKTRNELKAVMQQRDK